MDGKSVFFTKGDNTDDWIDVKTAGPDGLVGYVGPIYEPGVVIADEWVGYGDAVDYKEFTLDKAAKLTFDVTATDAAKFTVYALESKTDKKGTTYNLKSKLSTSLSKAKGTENFSVTTKELLLEAGTYYLAVESTNAKKGGSADYAVAVDGKSVFFTKGDNSDDLWDAAPAFAATEDWSDWVGFGDKIDCRALAIDANGGFYDFALSGVTENVKLTVYRVEGKTDKNGVTTYSLKNVKSVTATAKKPTVSTGDLCFAADTEYVVAVEAPDAAKAKNSDYTVKMTEKAVFVNRGNESWEDAVAPTEGFDGVLTTAAGGDKFDYFDLADVDLLALDMTQGKVKVSFYGEDQKAVKVAEVTMADGSVKKNVSGLTLEAGKTTDSFTLADVGDAVKYLKIEAATGNLNTYRFSLIA